ncbi:L domain-like protein [Rhizoclosmatium globosum]|uniref:L domain-like protein n=1 Tax=Rhizoclosmatium globosum TaxID=329046 RepID=A0A1Y2CAT8_9FUNG|nr:L domain-like protein [Rhizoclosmatium globosum]|eukprot:ORY44152.1 L domain-like protein [Rhizoclosmatium globosum]
MNKARVDRTDCDILHSIFDWIPPNYDCCYTTNDVICSTDSSRRALYLKVQGLNYTGDPVPVKLFQLTELRSLLINVNNPGIIPPQIQNLKELQYLQILSLSRSGLVGSLPTEIGKLTNLNYMSIVGHNLTGSIPTELGQLSQLSQIDLSRNSLSGNLSQLNLLLLGGNQLTGQIPNSIFQMPQLISLDVSCNNVTFNPSIVPQRITILCQANNLQLKHGVYVAESYSLLGLSSLLLTIFLGFVLFIEGPKPTQTTLQYIRRISTSFNITLALMIICVFALTAIELSIEPNHVYDSNTVQSFLMYLFTALNILEAVFPVNYWVIKGYEMYVCPVIIFAQVWVGRSGLVVLFTILPIIAGSCTVLFDVKNTRRDKTDSVDSRFLLICIYGAISSIGCQTTAVLIFISSGKMSDVSNYYKGRLIIVFGILLAVTTVLLAMKLHLYGHARWEQHEKNKLHSKAREVAQSGHFGGSAAASGTSGVKSAESVQSGIPKSKG